MKRMLPSPLFSLLTLFLLIHVNAWAQLSAPIAAAKDLYLRRFEAAGKNKDEAVARLEQGYENEIKKAQNEMTQAFDALIQAAALRNRTEEVRQLTLQKEALISGKGGSPQSISITGQGTDYKDLQGTWTTPPSPSNSYNYTYEFKANKDVVQTYEYRSNGENVLNTLHMKADQKDDIIVITNANRPNSQYEIRLPFNPNELTITYQYTSSNSSNSRSYKLVRKQ